MSGLRLGCAVLFLGSLSCGTEDPATPPPNPWEVPPTWSYLLTVLDCREAPPPPLPGIYANFSYRVNDEGPWRGGGFGETDARGQIGFTLPCEELGAPVHYSYYLLNCSGAIGRREGDTACGEHVTLERCCRYP